MWDLALVHDSVDCEQNKVITDHAPGTGSFRLWSILTSMRIACSLVASPLAW